MLKSLGSTYWDSTYEIFVHVPEEASNVEYKQVTSH